MSRDPILLIEELAANAWPAESVQHVDGWRLRHTPGDRSRRVNSVWPNRKFGEVPLEEQLALVEDFYARRGLPVRYQICPAAQPTDLKEILAARGYRADAHTQVQVAPLDFVLVRVKGDLASEVQLSETLPNAWLDFYAAIEEYNTERKAVRRAILSRIGARACYASLIKDEQIAAIGLGVLERSWLGVFCMLTHPDQRRRGAATAILQALGTWGGSNGATHTYLQVMENNQGGSALYARAGYKKLYLYYYLEKAPIAR